MKLEGKVAVITGGSKGTGWAAPEFSPGTGAPWSWARAGKKPAGRPNRSW